MVLVLVLGPVQGRVKRSHKKAKQHLGWHPCVLMFSLQALPGARYKQVHLLSIIRTYCRDMKKLMCITY